MTEGEYRVGIDFNPSGDKTVARIKQKAADLIDDVLSSGKDSRTAEEAANAVRDWRHARRQKRDEAAEGC